MYTLVSFATYWGSKYGGINAFNADFLVALGQDGLVQAIDISGKTQEPFFTENDLEAVARAIKAVVDDLEKARNRAATLRSQLAVYTWSNCVAKAIRYFAWHLPTKPHDMPQPQIETPPPPSLTSTPATSGSPLVMLGKH